MSLVEKITTKFYVAESCPDKVKIIWNNSNTQEFKDNINKTKYEFMDDFNRIYLCSDDELLFVWNEHLYYIKNNEDPILLVKNVGTEHIFYSNKHKKIIIVDEGTSRDFLFIYELEELKKCSGDICVDKYFDSFPWNNSYGINQNFIYCLHDNGIYAIDIKNLKFYNSNITHYTTEYDNDNTYTTDQLLVNHDNIISHIMINDDEHKKIIKIKFFPESGEFSIIPEKK